MTIAFDYKLQVSLRFLFQLITHSECSITAHIGGTNSTLHLIPCLLLNGKETANNVRIVTFRGLTLWSEHLPIDTVSYPRRLKATSELLSQQRISHSF